MCRAGFQQPKAAPSRAREAKMSHAICGLPVWNVLAPCCGHYEGTSNPGSKVPKIQCLTDASLPRPSLPPSIPPTLPPYLSPFSGGPTARQLRKYGRLFCRTVARWESSVGGQAARELFLLALPEERLPGIWGLSDIDGDGRLA